MADIQIMENFYQLTIFKALTLKYLMNFEKFSSFYFILYMF